MILAALNWNVDRVIVNAGPFALRWYSLLFASAFLVGYLITSKIYKKEGRDIELIDNLLLYLILGTIIGARLGHCLFYEPSYYLSHPLQILMVWKGGLASHGGALGIMGAIYLYRRKYQEYSYLELLDRLCISATLGGAFIRIGNFFNSEILGKTTDLPWAIRFLKIDPVPRHPVQLYESIAYLTIFIILWLIFTKTSTKFKQGSIFGMCLIMIFSSRIVLEFFKLNQAPFTENWLFSVGQLLSIPMIALGGWFILKASKNLEKSL